jgi:hypothetical protein
MHDYGTLADTMILLKTIHNVVMLIPYEQLFIQAFQKNGKLIPEQYSGEPNPLFQLVINEDRTSQPSYTILRSKSGQPLLDHGVVCLYLTMYTP